MPPLIHLLCIYTCPPFLLFFFASCTIQLIWLRPNLCNVLSYRVLSCCPAHICSMPCLHILLAHADGTIQLIWPGPKPRNVFLLNQGSCPPPGGWVVGQNGIIALLHPTSSSGQ
jgi:hypothetical protein